MLSLAFFSFSGCKKIDCKKITFTNKQFEKETNAFNPYTDVESIVLIDTFNNEYSNINDN